VALNTSKCNHPAPLRFKGLNDETQKACMAASRNNFQPYRPKRITRLPTSSSFQNLVGPMPVIAQNFNRLDAQIHRLISNTSKPSATLPDILIILCMTVRLASWAKWLDSGQCFRTRKTAQTWQANRPGTGTATSRD